MFSLWCIDWVGSLYANRFFMYYILRVASEPRVKLTSCKSALNPLVVYSADRSKAVVPVLVCCFVVYSTRRFIVCLFVCHFVLVFFSPFSIAITSLGEERADLRPFGTFVRFVLVWICRFPLPLGVWEGLWFVIVAPPGLFSYLFFLTAIIKPLLPNFLGRAIIILNFVRRFRNFITDTVPW